MKNLHLLIGTIVGTLALIAVVVFMFGGSPDGGQTGNAVAAEKLIENARHIQSHSSAAAESTTASATPAPQATTEPATDSASTESETAELVTIVEFSDFQCPACRSAQPLVKQVLAQYPEQVQLVYRHFPLDSIHPNARLAATASEAVAALDQEQFWPYHDRLFETQQEWGKIVSRDELTEIFATYATEIGIDKTEFLEKMKDTTLTQLVAQDTALGTEIGINSTPTFFVNGVQTTTTQLMAVVEAAVQK